MVVTAPVVCSVHDAPPHCFSAAASVVRPLKDGSGANETRTIRSVQASTVSVRSPMASLSVRSALV